MSFVSCLRCSSRLLRTSVCVRYFCTFYSGRDLYLILGLFLLLARWLLAWTVDPMLRVPKSVYERNGMGSAPVPDCGVWGHTLGALFPSSLSLSVVSSLNLPGLWS